MSDVTSAPLIYLVACEPSGDHLGALLMRALKSKTGGAVQFAGVGGEQMRAQGLRPLFDPKDLALLGIFEVLPKTSLVFSRVKATLKDIRDRQPLILVTIDSWGFTGRIHKALAKEKSTILRVRYVAPQVWAWRPGRAKQLSQWIHHLLALLPFEPKYFTPHGLATTWVGHPIVEKLSQSGDGAWFRQRHNIGEDRIVIGVLPGSRRGEVERLLPIFLETIKRIRTSTKHLHVVIPTVETVHDFVLETLRRVDCDFDVTVIADSQEREKALSSFDVALAASGTVSLELAAARVPHVVGYKVNALSALAFRYLAKTSRVNLVNIVLDEDIVPERLQTQCVSSVLAADLILLIKDVQARESQLNGFAAALSKLAPMDILPSEKAASVVLSLVRDGASGEFS